MRIYLAGIAGPDQAATKWLLEQRGYESVVCDSDILRKSYPYNRGMSPSKRDYQRFRSLEMAQAQLVVIGPEEPRWFIAVARAAAAFAGVPVISYDRLPAKAPGIMREDQVFAELVATAEAPARKGGSRKLLAWANRMADAFNARFGWFFTNGNKVAARPQPYAEPRAAHNITD